MSYGNYFEQLTYLLFLKMDGENVRQLGRKSSIPADLFWLRDESLEDTANLPDPDVLAVEIVEDLQAALEQFSEIAEDVT